MVVPALGAFLRLAVQGRTGHVVARPDLFVESLVLVPFLLDEFPDVAHLVLELPDLEFGCELLLLEFLGFLPLVLACLG